MGVGAYRTAFGEPQAAIGPLPDMWVGTRMWILPSPSGANGSYPLVDLVREMRAFRDAISNGGRLISTRISRRASSR